LPFWQRLENKDFDCESRDKLGDVPAADYVLRRLQEAKITPKALKDALGISSSMASRILDGSRGISTWHLDAVAALLKVSVPELFTERDLTGHGRDQTSDLSGEESADVPASAATTRIQQSIDYEKALQDVIGFASTLLVEAQRARREGPSARTTQHGPRRRTRKDR